MAPSDNKLAGAHLARRIVVGLTSIVVGLTSIALGLTSIALAGFVLLANGCAEGTPGRCTGCNGCCLYGQCMPGDTPTACGHSGYDCLTCPTGSSCVNGECQAAASCGPGTCAGCCWGTQCLTVSQQNNSACGTGGVSCQVCNGQCTNGRCLQPTGCDSATCQGCCTATDQCLQYGQQSASQCGTGGNPCQPCGEQCVNGQCVAAPCSAATCAAGCCQGSVCVEPKQQSPSACGSGGITCLICTGPNESCLDGSCQVVWKVLATSAQVTNKPTGDWDETYVPGGGPLPDPVLECSANASQTKGTSSFVNDTLSPNWGNTLLFVETEPILASGVTCDVFDDDSFIIPMRELLGQCTFFGLAPLAPGPRTSNSCTSYVTQITISFARN